MNEQTHEIKNSFYFLAGVHGILTGEFLRNTNIPDGRCFFTDLRSKHIFCYFTKGEVI